MTDANGFLTFYNDAAAEFWGQKPELNRARWSGAFRLYKLDGNVISHEEGPVAQTIRTGQPTRQEGITERPDGQRIQTLAFPCPIKDQDGRVVGVVNLLTDITDRHQSEGALARIAAIVSSSDDAIVTKTLTGRITSWNKSASRIFGFSEEEMIGQPIFRIIPNDLHDEERRILSQIERGEHVRHYETVRLAKDGRRVDISLTISPLYDRTGKVVGASKVARDITEKKRSEELQRLLLGELNHRVKNTLAIVQSIATQTLRRASSPEEFTASFSGRVQALARAHTLFSRDVWQGTEITDLLCDQLMLNEEEDDQRISSSGPSLFLDPQTALSLSMILHELGTNARKHGALTVPEGRISIKWELHPGGGHIVLNWLERDGPLVHPPIRRGFGTTLIEKGLKAHGGKTVIHYELEGLSCEIQLPLPKATQLGLSLPLPLKGEASNLRNRGDNRSSLKGKRILVIEDEPLVSMDLENCLIEFGSIVIGPAGTIDDARNLIDTEEFDAALVDANLGGQPVGELAEALTKRDIPFLFLTGYGRESLPAAFRNAGLVAKPYTCEQLIVAAELMLNLGPTQSE